MREMGIHQISTFFVFSQKTLAMYTKILYNIYHVEYTSLLLPYLAVWLHKNEYTFLESEELHYGKYSR